MSGPSNGGMNKEALSFGRYSLVTMSMSSKLGGEAGLVGWIQLSRFRFAVLLFKNVTQRCKRIFYGITLVRFNQINSRKWFSE